jgi:hypothetical protein
VKHSSLLVQNVGDGEKSFVSITQGLRVSDKREVGNTVVLPVETFQLQVSWPNAFKYLEVAFLQFLAIFMAVFKQF